MLLRRGEVQSDFDFLVISFSYRAVCESLVSTESAPGCSELYWKRVAYVVQHLIGSVDYKGVREIMKVV